MAIPLGLLEDVSEVGHLIDVSWCDNLVRPDNSLYLTPQLLLDLWVCSQQIEHPTKSVRSLGTNKLMFDDAKLKFLYAESYTVSTPALSMSIILTETSSMLILPEWTR